MAPLSFFNFHHRLDLHRVGSSIFFLKWWSAASSSPTAWSAGRSPASLSLTPKWYLPRSVALRVVAAHQKVRYTTAGEPATDLTGVLPDHRCVMTDAWPGTLSGVICHLFLDPLLGKFHRCNSPLFFGKIRRPSDPYSRCSRY